MIGPNFILGLVLLLAGRKLFWISVGIIGFLIGMDYTEVFVDPTNGVMTFVMALCLGIVGAGLAYLFQWAAIILVGFLGGGYLLVNILFNGLLAAPVSYVVFILGGIIGLSIMVLTFDWALIGYSALLGTILLVRTLNVDEATRVVCFVAILAVGVIVQCLTFRIKEGVNPNEGQGKLSH